MKVRTATESDVPVITKIYNRAVLETTATYDYEQVTEASRREWLLGLQEQGYVVCVAEDAAHGVVGWGAMTPFHVRKGYRFTVTNALYVAVEHQGKGVGRQLLEDQLVRAQEHGWHSIMALIDADNAGSIRLHDRQGFEQVAHLKEVGYKFDRWLDVVYLQRVFASNPGANL